MEANHGELFSASFTGVAIMLRFRYNQPLICHIESRKGRADPAQNQPEEVTSVSKKKVPEEDLEKYERGLDEDEDFDREEYAKERNAKSRSERVNHLKQKKNRRSKALSVTFCVIQIAASCALLGFLAVLNVLPLRYLIVIGLVLAVLAIFTIVTQNYRNGRVVGRVFAGIISAVLIVGSVYVAKTYTTLRSVTQASGNQTVTVKLADVSVIVKMDSSAENIQDLNGGNFGIQKTIGRDVTDDAISQIDNDLGENIKTTEFDSHAAQVQALYDGKVDAIIVNEVYRTTIEETYPNFGTDTKVIASYTVEQKVVVNNEASKIDVTTEPFNVYLSGNDNWGEVTLDDGRADVNIIATVNPKTRTILLTSTPRDYYVNLALDGEPLDKLTHAGIYGIDCSMGTLENLYDIDLNYYVRINFGGFQTMVDALGGVDVVSDLAFTTTDGTHSYKKGVNHLDGYAALLFVRERKVFSNGDLQRGRNEMLMIEAMIDKVTSPAILTNYMSFMDSVSHCFLTNMPADMIQDLIKVELENSSDWTIITNSVTGGGAMRETYSGGSQRLSVVLPSEESVAAASELIHKVLRGEKVTQPEINTDMVYVYDNDPYVEESSESSLTEESVYVNPGDTSQESSLIDYEESSWDDMSGGDYEDSTLYPDDSSGGGSESSVTDSGMESGGETSETPVDPNNPGGETSSGTDNTGGETSTDPGAGDSGTGTDSGT